MATDTGIKRSWQLIRLAGHKMGYEVQHHFRLWLDGFEGVSNSALMDATKLYIEHKRGMVASSAPTQESAMRRGHKGWPWPSVVGRFVANDNRVAPPPMDDLIDCRWWPPTGSTITATQWAERSAMEMERSAHLDAPCHSAWLTSTREIQALIRIYYAWDPSWPTPYEVKPSVQIPCGLWCAVVGHSSSVDHKARALCASIELDGDDLSRFYRLEQYNKTR